MSYKELSRNRHVLQTTVLWATLYIKVLFTPLQCTAGCHPAPTSHMNKSGVTGRSLLDGSHISWRNSLISKGQEVV